MSTPALKAAMSVRLPSLCGLSDLMIGRCRFKEIEWLADMVLSHGRRLLDHSASDLRFKKL